MRFYCLHVGLEFRALIFVKFKLIRRLFQRLEERFEFLEAALVHDGERLRGSRATLLNGRVGNGVGVHDVDRGEVFGRFIRPILSFLNLANTFVSKSNPDSPTIFCMNR